jgi:hypothetical protein
MAMSPPSPSANLIVAMARSSHIAMILAIEVSSQVIVAVERAFIKHANELVTASLVVHEMWFGIERLPDRDAARSSSAS